MKDKHGRLLLSLFLIVLYTAVMAVLLFLVCRIRDYENGTAVIVFQGIEIFIILGIDILAIYVGKIHIGHKTAALFFTAVYSLAVDLFSITAYARMAAPRFLLIHTVIVFAYFLLILPMVYKGICHKTD